MGCVDSLQQYFVPCALYLRKGTPSKPRQPLAAPEQLSFGISDLHTKAPVTHCSKRHMAAAHCTMHLNLAMNPTCLEILSDLSHKPLKWKLPDKQLCGLLILPDLT